MLKIFEPLDFKDAKPKRQQQTYVVQLGDTIPGIALRHGMKEAEVRAINNLWDGNVFAGQEIMLQRKPRSQSMSSLPTTDDFLDLESKQEPQTKTTPTTTQTEEEPAVEDENAVTSPTKFKSRPATLDVILEQHTKTSYSDMFSSWFRVLTRDNQDEDAQETKKKKKAEKKRAPRRKPRSYSERQPTNQEEENDVYALPKLTGATDADILSDTRYGPKLVPKIEAFLPMRLRGYDWKLLYSLAQHGSSLHSLMRKSRGERATLIIVETCAGEVFGGFAAAPWTNDASYYGSGESFVFTTVPTFQVFNWQRTNSMFMFSNEDAIAMGGGGGFAWYLNSDLSHGSTAVSETFGNRPLTSQHDFEVAHCEVWGFAMF